MALLEAVARLAVLTVAGLALMWVFRELVPSARLADHATAMLVIFVAVKSAAEAIVVVQRDRLALKPAGGAPSPR